MKAFAIISLLLIQINVRAQSHEVKQLLLNYEKLTQLKNILADMKKGYDIVSKGYTAIKDISEGNFSLHNTFMNGLIEVNPSIKKYKRIADILSHEKSISKEYKKSFNRFKQCACFTSSEIDYLELIYQKLFRKSLQNMDELMTIITASELSISDDERLKAIDRIFADSEDKLQFLRNFNKRVNLFAIQKLKEKQDVERISRFYIQN